ncbi:MAG: hypothetical protein ABJC36_10335 [Gemmatimonadales bacterium]
MLLSEDRRPGRMPGGVRSDERSGWGLRERKGVRRPDDGKIDGGYEAGGGAERDQPLAAKARRGGHEEVGTAQVHDAALAAGRGPVVAPGMAGGGMLEVARDVRRPGADGHGAARARHDSKAQGDDGGHE